MFVNYMNFHASIMLSSKGGGLLDLPVKVESYACVNLGFGHYILPIPSLIFLILFSPEWSSIVIMCLKARVECKDESVETMTNTLA